MTRFWATTLLWGVALTLVLSFGAFVGEKFSGTCMFILMPYFAALAAAVPVVRVGRFGAGMVTYLPYAVLGFAPRLYFDWLQSHALRGLWAVFAWSASGPLIGLCADLVYRFSARLEERWRGAIVGAVVQAATFAVMLAGLSCFTWTLRARTATRGCSTRTIISPRPG